MKLPKLSSEQRKWTLVSVIVALVIVSIGQLLYPRDHLVPFAVIDSVTVGGWAEKDATWELDRRLARQPISITIKETNQTYRTIKPQDIGLVASNQSRVEAASYPLWARLIPSSLLWYQALYSNPPPQYKRDEVKLSAFVRSALGDCKLAPKDASIRFSDDELQLVPAAAGGSCEKGEVVAGLNQVAPTVVHPASLAIEATIKKPKVSDETAKTLIKKLEANSKNGIMIAIGDDKKTISQKEIVSWLTFTPKGNALVVGINQDVSGAYLTKNITPLVTVPAGTTTVTTRDFTELSRKNGKAGRTLDSTATQTSLLDVLEGKVAEAKVATQSVKPKVSYTRSYTKTSTGISAMLTHYSQDNVGVFGVSFVELGGERRSAQYNQDRIFTTASTYKLFVAFSTLKHVDSGTYKWSDKVVDGRNLSTCFDDMIVKSDNPCAEALLEKIGRKQLDEDLRSIGLTSSTFRAKSNQTTASELATFLTKLQNSDLPIKSASRGRLLGAMKRQIHRQGIPAGTNAAVADKVGFLNGLLHDAAIVYSPQGNYVLVILSDNSTWANIAELTKKIEALR